jgi:hypothetical protein
MAMFPHTVPASGDQPETLWRKINQVFSERNGGVLPPQNADDKTDSMAKVLQLLTGLLA